MAYIDSNNIKVFPSAKRGVDYPEARLTTEATFVSIINKLIDYDGFVISPTFEENSPFEFNLHGYYFYIAHGNDLLNKLSLTNETSIYAGIYLTQVGDNLELSGVDFSGQYEGVTFTAGSPPTGSQYSIQILSRPNTTVGWAPVNTVKFDQSSLNLTVDGGII